MKDEKKLRKIVKTRSYYAVVAALVLMIAGISAAIINVSRLKDTSYEMITRESTEIYSVPTTEFRANLNQTGVADERTTSEIKVGNAPYKGSYILPIENKVIKNFSDGDMAYSKTMQDWRVHNGLDILATKGESVRAVDDGTVTGISNDEMWGGCITVTHLNGLVVKYIGVKPTVSEGTNVRQGDIIAQIDNIPVESADGVHLHIECKVDEKIVDPLKALNLITQASE